MNGKEFVVVVGVVVIALLIGYALGSRELRVRIASPVEVVALIAQPQPAQLPMQAPFHGFAPTLA